MRKRQFELFNPVPRKVCLVALGASSAEYLQHMVAQELNFEFDQIWTLNMGLRVFRHDVLWVMDDLRTQAKKYPAYGRLLAEHDRPIITSTAYPEFPMSVRYPIEQVIDQVGDDLFTNTVCYALAWAMVAGVKDMTLYGADFWYPRTDLREEGGMNAGYFLGLARHFGMDFHLPQSTTLLSSYLAQDGQDGNLHRKLYGYAKQPLFATGVKNGRVTPGPGGAQVRAGEGNHASESKGNKTLLADKIRGQQSAVVHPAGKSVSRKRTRNAARRAPGLVLDGNSQSQPRSADGSGLDGEDSVLSPQPSVPTRAPGGGKMAMRPVRGDSADDA